MEAGGFIFKRTSLFIMKYFFFALIFLILLVYARIGYCYFVASSSAEQLLPQVARFVAEDNGLVIDLANNNYADILGNHDDSVFGRANVAGANNRTHHYYIPTSSADFKSGMQVSGHEPALRVYRVDDTTKTNVCEASEPNLDSSNPNRVVQRGEILVVEI